MVALGSPTAGSAVAASVTTQDYPACSESRLHGADLILLKRAILSRAILNPAQRVNSPEAADLFFEANQIIVAPVKLRRSRRDFIAYVRGPRFVARAAVQHLSWNRWADRLDPDIGQ